MATGTGLDGSIGVATEAVSGVYAPPTRHFLWKSDSLARVKNVVQGSSFGSGQFDLSALRAPVTRMGKGGVALDLVDRGMGILLDAAFGSSSVVPRAGVAGVTDMTFTPVGLRGKTLSVQVGRPTSLGGVEPFTYVGSKVTDIDFTIAQSGIAELAVGLVAQDEQTLGTVLLAAPSLSGTVTAGGTNAAGGQSYVVTAASATGESLPSNEVTLTFTAASATGVLSWPAVPQATGYNIYRGAQGAETRLVGGQPVATNTFTDTGAVANGGPARPTSATALGPALVTPTPSLLGRLFSFAGATLQFNGQTAANVTKVNCKLSTGADVSRFFIGAGGTPGEMLQNAMRKVDGTIEAEFANRTLYDAFCNDTAMAMVITLLGSPIGATGISSSVTITVPSVRLDGSTPPLAGAGVLKHSLPYVGLAVSGAPAIQVVTTTADTAL